MRSIAVTMLWLLLSEAPTSRAHAAWVRRYRGWLQFRSNHLAMVGLITVLVMIVASLAAPLIAPQDPTAQDLAGGWHRHRLRTGWAPTSWARPILARAVRRADHAGDGGRGGAAGRAARPRGRQRRRLSRRPSPTGC
jgi:ABC-type dipeptide/oligopeptide/nickel transport system permease subunit